MPVGDAILLGVAIGVVAMYGLYIYTHPIGK